MRHLTFAALAIFLVLLSGCSPATNRWALPSPNLADHPRGDQAKTCGVPLTVAVRPFSDERVAADHSIDGALWFGIGMFAFSPHFDTHRADGPPSENGSGDFYVHEDSRLFAGQLQRELDNTGCFDIVAFDPIFPYAYDLVLTGRILRTATRTRAPFVPLPFWAGTIAAAAFSQEGTVVEVELMAMAPGGGQVFVGGVQGACTTGKCVRDRAHASQVGLIQGYAPFIASLRTYFSTRSAPFWQAARDARFRRFIAEWDPELVVLDRTLRKHTLPCAATLEGEVDSRRAFLAEAYRSLVTRERVWAIGSDERFATEVKDSNESMVLAKKALRSKEASWGPSDDAANAQRAYDAAANRVSLNPFTHLNLALKSANLASAQANQAEFLDDYHSDLARMQARVAAKKQATVGRREQHESVGMNEAVFRTAYAAKRKSIDVLLAPCSATGDTP